MKILTKLLIVVGTINVIFVTTPQFSMAQKRWGWDMKLGVGATDMRNFTQEINDLDYSINSSSGESSSISYQVNAKPGALFSAGLGFSGTFRKDGVAGIDVGLNFRSGGFRLTPNLVELQGELRESLQLIMPEFDKTQSFRYYALHAPVSFTYIPFEVVGFVVGADIYYQLSSDPSNSSDPMEPFGKLGKSMGLLKPVAYQHPFQFGTHLGLYVPVGDRLKLDARAFLDVDPRLSVGTVGSGANKPAIGVGVIGCGDRGKGIMHLINNSSDSGFRTVGYADVLPFRLKEAEQYADSSAKAYADYRQLLDNKAITAVVIAVPLSSHYQVASDAIRAGKHVYLEKTMTFTIAEALDLANLVRSRPKQVFQVGYQYRYSPLYFKVKEMIQTGYLGEVTQIDCRWDRNNNWRRSVPDPKLERQINWRMYREYSGGVVAELLSHQMDFIHWAFETHPDEIVGYGGIDIYRDGRETFDNVQLMLRYKKQGIIGNFGTTLGNGRDGYLFRIKGTKGTVSLLPSTGVFYPERAAVQANDIVDGVTGATKIVRNKDGGIPILEEPTKDGTHYALADFYKAITENTTPASDIYTGTKGTICAALANESLYTGKIMYWKDEYNLG